jgi:hypothetical protein
MSERDQVERRFRDSIALDAFRELLRSAEDEGFKLRYHVHGSKKAVHFVAGDGLHPFAAIANNSHLKFYIRGPVLKSNPGLYERATLEFNAVEPNDKGEYRVDRRTPDEVRDLIAWLREQNVWHIGTNTENRRNSEKLDVGKVYSRQTLIESFSIQDATINNGVFRPKGSKSIWLFVTRHKTRDRVQYEDRLDGDLLHWEGQVSGRTDKMIIEHEYNGDELLLFYRESKHEHPSAGFLFEGSFRYISHKPGRPSRFVFQRCGSAAIEELVREIDEQFDPNGMEDGRQKILSMIVRRQGQAAFRRKLMKVYDGACAITECKIEPLLEAAHISPYLGPETNDVTNGLLLRADIHTLFDLGLITIDSQFQIEVSARLDSTEYSSLAGKRISQTAAAGDMPSLKALASHRERHCSGKRSQKPVH